MCKSEKSASGAVTNKTATHQLHTYRVSQPVSPPLNRSFSQPARLPASWRARTHGVCPVPCSSTATIRITQLWQLSQADNRLTQKHNRAHAPPPHTHTSDTTHKSTTATATATTAHSTQQLQQHLTAAQASSTASTQLPLIAATFCDRSCCRVPESSCPSATAQPEARCQPVMPTLAEPRAPNSARPSRSSHPPRCLVASYQSCPTGCFVSCSTCPAM